MHRAIRYRCNAACLVTLLALFSGPSAWGQLKAFPEAEGFGANATGGRGGSPLAVRPLPMPGAFGKPHGRS